MKMSLVKLFSSHQKGLERQTKESELLLKVKRDYIAVCRVQNHYRETENLEQTG